jgi:site-specific DNA-methyltransferase (adenine-specific)
LLWRGKHWGLPRDALGPFTLGRVYRGDCRALLRRVPTGSVHCVFTDPPYGHNQNAGDLNAMLHAFRRGLFGRRVPAHRAILNDGPEAFDLVRSAMGEVARVLALDSAVCCCCSGGGGSAPKFAAWSLMLDEAPWRFFHMVVWDKGGLGLGWRYRRNYELVLVAHLRAGKCRWPWRGKGPETANVVRVKRVSVRTRDRHPTEKPVDLVRHFLRLHTAPGDIVLDPFAGSGSTGVAALLMGRRYLGFELDPHWCRIANARLRAVRKTLAAGPSITDGMIG